jgi:hypothetical protein
MLTLQSQHAVELCVNNVKYERVFRRLRPLERTSRYQSVISALNLVVNRWWLVVN